jgi:hypothetical protein
VQALRKNASPAKTRDRTIMLGGALVIALSGKREVTL